MKTDDKELIKQLLAIRNKYSYKAENYYMDFSSLSYVEEFIQDIDDLLNKLLEE